MTTDNRQFESSPIVAVIGLVVTLFLSASCATGPIRPAGKHPSLPDEQRALVAFSIDSDAPLALVRIGLVAADGEGNVLGARDIAVEPRASAEAFHAFSVPVGEIQLSSARFLFQGAWWETTLPGPIITVAPNSMTYLGRLKTEAVKVRRYIDSGRDYPAAVMIRLVDAREDDLAIAERLGRLPPGVPVVTAAPAGWAEGDFTELAYRPIPGRSDRETIFDWARDNRPVGPAIPAPRGQNP